MRKLFLGSSLALLTFFIVSCKGETKKEESAEKTEVQETPSVKETTAQTEKAEKKSNNIPTFSNKKVQDYVNAYEEYISAYRKAVENNDMAALGELGQKGQELGQKSQELTTELNGDDITKFTEYMKKKSEELMEISNKLSQ
ncbi:hypothetical protein [Abyssalbus ytuae]|uniref:Lipoprotein n=1 Tax=Abyssalbus ytuae TaxID=2926907 RepID=A0A9E6ZS67_9FLAO|nr:hypothetical protein [Abyssalbus ytuae]UOB17868.1 hypothetical protein MQE35_00895 [Abyssalbus ytuae]